MEIPTKPASPANVDVAEQALRRGDRQLAHELCIKISAKDPANERAWMLLAQVAESAGERLDALDHVLRLSPDSRPARQALYDAMQQLLREDAFLAYQGETDTNYHISTPEGFDFMHPKDRAVARLFSPSKRSPAGKALHWLGLTALGLIPAGLGVLVFAPVVMLAAMRALRQPLPALERRRAWIALWGAIILWPIAWLLAYIIVLHLG